MNDVIEKQGNYKSINKQIQQTVIMKHKILNKYTSKMNTETLISYTAAVLDSQVKTEFLKTHLQESVEAVIDNLQTHFKELSSVKK